MIFITKHIQDSEFIILWTSGVKKIEIVNLFFYISILILLIYLVLAVIITPYFLNKSRFFLLSNDNVSSFLPTIKREQFSDTFKNFTFFVENKNNNQIENIFYLIEGNKLKSLSSNDKNKSSTVIVKKGLVNEKKLLLFNGQIITSKKDNTENEIIKFEQINIDLSDLNTSTIKKLKAKETSNLKLLDCFFSNTFANRMCNNKLREEITSVLNRRLFLPLYIPVLALICSIQLIKLKKLL